MTRLRWSGEKAFAFLRRDFLFETSYRFQTLFQFVSLMFTLVVLYFLSRMVGDQARGAHLARYGGDFFSYALVGMTFLGLFNTGLTGFTSSLRQQVSVGVLEAMAAAPIGSASLLFFSILYPLGAELVKAVLYIVAGTLFFGAHISFPRIPIFLSALALSVLTFGSLGIIAGSLLIYFKRGDPVAWFFSSLSFLAGGVLIPVTALPGWIQKLAGLLPITYALEALRASLLTGADTSRAQRSLLGLLLFSAVLVPIAVWCARVVFDGARKRGNLGHY